MPNLHFTKHDVLPSSSSPTAPTATTTPNPRNGLTTRQTQELSGTVIAGVAVLIALLALIVGLLQLRNERQKRREARELEHELMELEAEVTEVRLIRISTPWKLTRSRGYEGACLDGRARERKRGARCLGQEIDMLERRRFWCFVELSVSRSSGSDGLARKIS
jgi:hypothetical protein